MGFHFVHWASSYSFVGTPGVFLATLSYDKGWFVYWMLIIWRRRECYWKIWCHMTQGNQKFQLLYVCFSVQYSSNEKDYLVKNMQCVEEFHTFLYTPEIQVVLSLTMWMYQKLRYVSRCWKCMLVSFLPHFTKSSKTEEQDVWWFA